MPNLLFRDPLVIASSVFTGPITLTGGSQIGKKGRYTQCVSLYSPVLLYGIDNGIKATEIDNAFRI